MNKELSKSITIKNNILLFTKSCLSQWYGAYKNQNSAFTINLYTILDYVGKHTSILRKRFYQKNNINTASLDYDFLVENTIFEFNNSLKEKYIYPFEKKFGLNEEDIFSICEHIKFNCAEQAMMFIKACVFGDLDCADKILNETDPSKQKELGRQVKDYDEEVWNNLRFEIVKEINLSKFIQNPHLYDFLVNDCKGYILAEAATWDTIWGIGLSADDPLAHNIATWKGKNLLGEVLMQVRALLTKY